MAHFIFVHGINVRGAELEVTAAIIADQLSKFIPQSTLSSCSWGDDFGARLRCNGASIPSYDATKSGVGVLPEFEKLALWDSLYKDPLIEFRLLASNAQSDSQAISPSAVAASMRFVEKVNGISSSPTIKAALPSGLPTDLQDAVVKIRTSQEFVACKTTNIVSSGALPGAVARSLIALLVQQANRAGIPTIQGRDRDIFVMLVQEELGGAPKGLFTFALSPFKNLALRISSAYTRRNRGSITDLVAPVIGDVIVYQGRGQAIRDRIGETIAGQPQPSAIIAHSLGGIAVLDTLLQRAELRQNVTTLFTVGSQGAFFYEINALIGLAHPDRLPDDFPLWYNYYDKSDVLSYLASPIFGTAVTDVEVKSDQPFPNSHSAYWTSPVLWDSVRLAHAKAYSLK